MLYFVYELIDPRTDTVAYVGITDDPNQRFREHLKDTKTNPRKQAWIEQLHLEHLEPHMRILEVVEKREVARKREAYWIQRYLQQDINLINIACNIPDDYYSLSEAAKILNATGTIMKVYVQKGAIKYFVPEGAKRGFYLKSDVHKLAMELNAFLSQGVEGQAQVQVQEDRESKQVKGKRGGAVKKAPEGYYTASEAQKKLGMRPSTFRYYVRNGKIKHYVPPLRTEGFYEKREINQLASEMALFLHTAVEERATTEVRIARPEDTPGIVNVLEIMGWRTASAAQRRSWYTVNPYIDYIVLWEGEVMGYIHAAPYKLDVLADMMSGKTVLAYSASRYSAIRTGKNIRSLHWNCNKTGHSLSHTTVWVSPHLRLHVIS